MRRHSFVAVPAVVGFAVAAATPAGAALKRVAYPEVKVEVAEAHKPDPALASMLKTFADAVKKKDSAALFALVGPTFVWTMAGVETEDFDMGRDALHNFKVVFSFRKLGKDTDGGVENGPSWDALAAFAADGSFYAKHTNQICTPTVADLADETVFEQARGKIETKQDTADWYFTLAETPVAKAPGDGGPQVAKVGTVALPVLSSHPPTPDGKPAVTPTHYEVLLPTGKTGWIPAAAARPLWSERLCFAKTPKGEWKIVSYDQPEE
jgi:hypothetical protein